MKTKGVVFTAIAVIVILANFIVLSWNISNCCEAHAEEKKEVDREAVIRNWSGTAVFLYQSKPKAKWQAVAIIIDYDEDYFCSDVLKEGMVEKGVPLIAEEPKKDDYQWDATFRIPEQFTGTAYKGIFLDSAGNVFFRANPYPKDACGDLMILATRSRAVKKHPKYGDGWVASPYNLQGTVYTRGYAGIKCPE